MSEANDYSCIHVETLTPKLGALVTGADLASLDDALAADIRRAFERHMVLVFRDQHLTREQHKAFGRAFGEPKMLHVLSVNAVFVSFPP